MTKLEMINYIFEGSKVTEQRQCSDEDIFEISKIYTYGEEEIEER